MSSENEKKRVGADLLIPGVALVFTLYYFSTIWDSPWTAQVSAFFIGSILIGLVGIFLMKSALELRRGRARIDFGDLLAPRALLPARAGLLLAAVGYVILIQWGGFTLTTGSFLFIAMTVLTRGRGKRVIAALSAGLAVSGYLLFIVAFETRLPRGPFEQLMAWAF